MATERKIQMDTNTVDMLIDANNPKTVQLLQQLKSKLMETAHGTNEITLSLIIPPFPVQMYGLPSMVEREQLHHEQYKHNLQNLIDQIELSGLKINSEIVSRSDKSSVTFSSEAPIQKRGLLESLGLLRTGPNEEVTKATTLASSYKQAMTQSGHAKQSAAPTETNEPLSAGTFPILSEISRKTLSEHRSGTSTPANKQQAKASDTKAQEESSHLPKPPTASR